MEYLVQFNAFQTNFKAQNLVDFMNQHIDIPVVLVTLYLTLIFYVPNNIMKNRNPVPCKTFFTLWNFVLTVFSIIGTYYTVPVLASVVWNHGVRFSACSNPDVFYFDGPVGFWVGMFILSKIPELMDTVFLVVQKKDVIFLHWFHHVTVMLYCWHAYTHKIGSGLWFAAMNFSVHSIMYFYYFLMAIGARSLVRPIAPLITSLQLLQMVVGMAVTIATFVWRQDSEGCHVDAANSRMGLAMYTSYFILFAVLFKKLYLTPGGRKSLASAGGKKSSTSAASPVTEGSSSTSTSKGGLCNVEEVQDGAGQFLNFDEKKKK
ncbi:fatty acid elongase, putative [Bodo saltans]|uniref:Elongation of fatty acids protein n=1 Tax=Bodo saltans TaxID=75058 RepID=A0A0S4IW98_BODSA|nr:fatty acid elongase, putative [Bodo saltans]|eukprot:CUG04822.1 fatty acid elongase, putative [Bodo saltans]